MILGFQTYVILITPYNTYLAGHFSFLHMLENGAPHYRYYSGFFEPGSLALLLVPSIIYAFLYKNIFGLLIFLIAMYLTDSLGGFIAIAMILMLLPVIFKTNKGKWVYGVSIIIVILIMVSFSSSFLNAYESKGNSASVRKDDLYKAIVNLPTVLLEAPLGIKLEISTEDYKKNKNYAGSNFTPGIYLWSGGILALSGYIVILLVSIFLSHYLFFKNNLNVEQRLVLSSILIIFPFIFQRTTIFESSLFALLFSPTLIRLLQSPSIDKNKNPKYTAVSADEISSIN